MLKEKNWYILFLLPTVLMFTFVGLFPLCYQAYLSFRQYNFARPWYPSGWIGLRNFHEILKDPFVWNSLQVTFIFVSAAVSIEFIFGLGIALLFSREEKKGKFIARTLIMCSMILPPVSVALIWKYLLNNSFGVVAIFLGRLGFTSDWYGGVKSALPTMILIDVWEWTPFVFLILLAGIISLPVNIYETARMDGASKWQIFTYITLPLLKPVMLIALLLRIIDALKVFDTIWILTRGGPIRVTEVYSVRIYRQGFEYFNMGRAAALSFIFLAISICLTVTFIKVSKFEI
ncbi:Trehalose transport system permease protein SugA [subsurface metagenome]